MHSGTNIAFLLFAEMLSAAPGRINAGMKIKIMTEGHFFDMKHLKTISKVKKTLANDDLFDFLLLLTQRKTYNTHWTVFSQPQKYWTDNQHTKKQRYYTRQPKTLIM